MESEEQVLAEKASVASVSVGDELQGHLCMG